MAIEYYYNVDTGLVEEGKQSNPAKLLGPYASKEEAQQALQRVEENNERWDEQDAEWEGQQGS